MLSTVNKIMLIIVVLFGFFSIPQMFQISLAEGQMSGWVQPFFFSLLQAAGLHHS